eukprot:3140983-Alexandrium_andersonii.AAC.1
MFPAESDSGAEMERFPRSRKNKNNSNNGKQVERLKHLEQFKQSELFELFVASGSTVVQAPKGGRLRTEC